MSCLIKKFAQSIKDINQNVNKISDLKVHIDSATLDNIHSLGSRFDDFTEIANDAVSNNKKVKEIAEKASSKFSVSNLQNK